MQDFIDTLLNGPARYTVEHQFSPLLTIVFILGIFFAELVALYALGFVLVTGTHPISRRDSEKSKKGERAQKYFRTNYK